MWRCNDELRVRADELHSAAKKDAVAKHYIGRQWTISFNPKAYIHLSYVSFQQRKN